MRLTSANPDDEPYVDFNWLSDPRDMDRMTDAFRRMARILASDPVPNYLSNLFASRLSQRVRNVSQKNFKNAVLTNVAAVMMDSSASLRKLLFDKVISDCLPLPELLADAGKLERHVRDNVQSAWHASCTCRMGDPRDAMTVVEPQTRVVGLEALRIADSSIIPLITNGNLNAPTIMIGEKASDHILGKAMLPPSNAPFYRARDWETRQR